MNVKYIVKCIPIPDKNTNSHWLDQLNGSLQLSQHKVEPILSITHFNV